MTEQATEGVGVKVEPGMRVNVVPDSQDGGPGVVVSTTEHGCFVRLDGGRVVGVDWGGVNPVPAQLAAG